MTEQLDQVKLARYVRHLRAQTRPSDYFVPLDHPQLDQRAFFESKKKNKGVFGGNRSGKTISGAVYVIQKCLDNPGFDCWGATWADLSVAIQQTEYYKMLPKDKSVKYAKFTAQRGFSNRIILFENGSQIRFKTYDQGRESFQGASKDIIHLDEEPDQDIVSECKARLIDRNGEMIRTMTPLRGVTYTADEFLENEIGDPEVEFWYWDNRFNEHIDQKNLKRIIGGFAKKEQEVRQQGHFLNLTTGNAYYPFSEENIIDSFTYMNGQPLEVDCDFNVDLMCWNIAQERQGKDYVFDFVEIENQANTEQLCLALKKKYQNHRGGITFYGDITGNKRDPAASRTNWAIVKQHFPNAKICYQAIKNVKDRVDSFNGRIRNAKGIHWYVTKNCRRLIKDMRQVTWEHLMSKSKAGKLTHASDGETYKMFWKHPLTGRITVKQW